MVKSCAAYGCHNREGQEEGRSFYRFPADRDRRRKWLAAVRRVDPDSRKPWQPSNSDRLCSDHFVGGKKSDHPLSPAFVPSLFSHVSAEERQKRQRELEAFERRQDTKRRKLEEGRRSAAASALLDLSAAQSTVMDSDSDSTLSADSLCLKEEQQHDSIDQAPGTLQAENKKLQQELGALQLECKHLRQENMTLRQKVADISWDQNGFEGNDTKVKDLTGFPSFTLFMSILNYLTPYLKDKTMLNPFQQMLLVCMRLKCDVNMQFLAYGFGVSRSTVSRVFNDVLTVMDRRLVTALIVWPDREQLRLTMPASFRQSFKKCACIIDCFEIFIERAADLKARAQTYSNYKSHNTMKYLIGITPQGVISFISKGWGGRASDKHITNNCGFLNNLLPGDLILADRGFDVGDSVGLYNAELKIPAFTKGKKQLSPLDLESTRSLASQRIHVERVIGLTRQKFSMLQSTISTTYLIKDQYDLTTLDKIVRVACALTNLAESVVPFD